MFWQAGPESPDRETGVMGVVPAVDGGLVERETEQGLSRCILLGCSTFVQVPPVLVLPSPPLPPPRVRPHRPCLPCPLCTFHGTLILGKAAPAPGPRPPLRAIKPLMCLPRCLPTIYTFPRNPSLPTFYPCALEGVHRCPRRTSAQITTIGAECSRVAACTSLGRAPGRIFSAGSTAFLSLTGCFASTHLSS